MFVTFYQPRLIIIYHLFDQEFDGYTEWRS
jgi:hypothetical protein